jgi:hypothetical protein
VGDRSAQAADHWASIIGRVPALGSTWAR